MCPKLSQNIIDLNGAQRMRVRPAAQLLSLHCSKLAKHCYPENPQIAIFIQTVNDIFDLFNTRTPTDSKCFAYGLNLESQLNLLHESIVLFESLRVLTNSNRCRKSIIWFQKGFLVSISSLQALYENLRQTYKVKYLLTSRLTQDALENIFSLIRSMGSRSLHPNPLEFKYRFRMLLLGARLPIPKGANCKPSEEDTILFSATLCQKANLSNIVEIQNDTEIDEIDKTIEFVIESAQEGQLMQESTVLAGQLNVKNEALSYIAGYIAYKLRKAGKFLDIGQPTAKCMQENDADSCQSWIMTLSKGGLLVPSENLLTNVKDMEDVFNSSYETFSRSTNIFKNLIEACNKKIPHVQHEIVEEFVKLRLKIRLKHLNEEHRNIKKQKWECKNAKKAKMFSDSLK